MAVEIDVTQREIHYRAGYRYQLAGDYHIDLPIFGVAGGTSHTHIDGTGHLVIREGYAWDGASGPAWDSLASMRASLVHDALYQLIRGGVLEAKHKAIADAVLEKILREDGMGDLRARLWRWAVTTFGRPATRPSHEPPVLVAP